MFEVVTLHDARNLSSGTDNSFFFYISNQIMLPVPTERQLVLW
jgi:hypothetical protein